MQIEHQMGPPKTAVTKTMMNNRIDSFRKVSERKFCTENISSPNTNTSDISDLKLRYKSDHGFKVFYTNTKMKFEVRRKAMHAFYNPPI